MQEDKNAIFQMRFPQKLWHLLNMHTDALLWGGTGRTILLNYRILHSYLQCNDSIFKTTNISSFVRQLNLYGFRKVTSHLQDPLCNSSNPYMHEYVHDYFQYGRPELLNKITRKALAMKKNFKPKILYEETEQTLYFTPLQKARQALRDALKNAAQEMFTQNLPRQFCSIRFEPEDGQDDYCEDEDNIEFDWFTNNEHKNTEEFPQRATDENTVNLVNNETFENSSQDNLMDFNDETSQQNNDNFSVQFLSMPELDPEPEANRHIELLAGFDIENNTHQNTITKIVKENEHHSLNCVLPSISNDATISSQMEKINDDSNHYHGEWDQMFSDMITYKSPNQECGSDLKELYSQISKTIDLLNS